MSLAAAEGLVRLVGRADADGQFFVRDRPLRPYRLPVRRLNRLLEHYRRNESKAAVRYDPNLGWIPRPLHRAADGIRATNADGIRGAAEYSRRPLPSVLRIAVFGDSYTFGAEVRDAASWPRVLERELVERGIPAEVLNFGVGGYGMGQAYLRWQIQGQRYEPDLVIFGFNGSNIARNKNVLRAILHRQTGLPFTKPRFVLDGGSLRPVNYPTLSLAMLPRLYASFAEHPLSAYEGHYREPTWWLSSKLLALIAAVVESRGAEPPTPDADARLATAIVRAFGESVRASGASFSLLHVPSQRYLAAAIEGRPLPYGAVLAGLGREFPLIDPVAAFGAFDPGYLRSGGHYSPRGNEIVGECVAAAIASCLADGRCRPARPLPAVPQARPR